jgi:hypothetical protein
MDPLTNSRPLSAPSHPFRPARGLLRRIYTSNPFYVISADLVFMGLRMSLDTGGTTFETWALMLALAGYTLLLATTACLLIRLGSVWDDVRTLLLLVVMMFLALSVTFDETLTSKPRLGVACDLAGLLFAVVVSEAVLRGIRLALPALFRVPYYLILALFFLYPAALVPLLGDPSRPALQWGLFGFSTLAGLAFLTLVPAIRRGPGYVAKNGSPWTFPLYPWVLFGLLALAVCGRAFYLCISLHFVERTAQHFVERSHSIFGAYFLVPFLFALDVLLLELGIVARSRAALRTAIVAPLGIMALAVVGPSSDPVFDGFLQIFMGQLGGSPLFLSLLGALAFYAMATVRGVPCAREALSLSLAALAVVGPSTLDLDSLVALQSQPILALGLLQLWYAWRRRDSRHGLFGAACLVAALTIDLGRTGSATFQGLLGFHLSLAAALALVAALTIDLGRTGSATFQGLLGFHLSLAAALALGAIFDDALGRLLRHAGAALLALACLFAVTGDPRLHVLAEVSPEMLRAYPLLLVAIAAGYGLLVGSRAYLAAAALGLGGWLALAGLRGYLYARQFVAGLDRIAWGMAFFLLATLISLAKAGLLRRWLERKPDGGDHSLA